MLFFRGMGSAQLEINFDAPAAPAEAAPLSRAAVPPTGAERLRAQIAARFGGELHLRITDNRSTLMSVKYARLGNAARLSLHHMFLGAGPEVVAALGHWVKHPRSRRHAEVLDAFMREHRHLIAPRRAREAAVRTRGQHHDLQQLFDELNAAEFGGRVDARITWGKMPPQRHRSHIRLGSYSQEEHLIRMHPLLDAAAVPAFFVRYVVFHEMLHADLGIAEVDGRRRAHTREFRERERAYAGFRAAEQWLADPRNLALVLGRRHPGFTR